MSKSLDESSPALRGHGALARASISTRVEAFTRQDEFALPAFPATIGCAAQDLTTALPNAKLRKLGPAVSFTASAPLSMGKVIRD